VLFPLDVKRIIFVDADQILRADVKELWDLDLGDAPYGYTPMCTSNTELEGFMFWKQVGTPWGSRCCPPQPCRGCRPRPDRRVACPLRAVEATLVQQCPAIEPACSRSGCPERRGLQGFWVEHLQGRPYHISALYVVDLQRFRLTRVGDRLRGIYDQLSRCAPPGRGCVCRPHGC
jgi:hypothetical protein